METTKVLAVTLSDADEKAMSRTTTRRRRTKRTAAGGEETLAVKEDQTPAADPAPAADLAPAADPAPAPAPTATPVPAPAPLTGGGQIKLAAKKNTTAAPLPTPPTKAPKIVMNKKRTSLPLATTLKKPKLVVGAVADVPKPVAKKRRFTERKISITIKPFASTRRKRKDIKDKVDLMSIANVKKMLLQKGLLKPNHKTPEDILRSMLHDYMTLHSDV
jgi:hypothetical protein